VLLVLVIAVWGTIAYKIVTALNPDLPEIQQQKIAVNDNYKVETTVDTFSISTVDRDPFLGTYTKKPSKRKSKKRTPIWIPIQYNGIVKRGHNQMFIVSIKGKQHLLKKGQVKDSVKLVYGNSTSITMRYKNSTKKFSLNTNK
jgi:hypothetical protein